MVTKFQRRHFLLTAAAIALAGGLQTTTVWGKTIKHKPLDDYLSHNINYLRDVLGVKLPPHST